MWTSIRITASYFLNVLKVLCLGGELLVELFTLTGFSFFPTFSSPTLIFFVSDVSDWLIIIREKTSALNPQSYEQTEGFYLIF